MLNVQGKLNCSSSAQATTSKGNSMTDMTDEQLETQREIEELRELEKAYQLEWAGKRAEAFEILWKFCLIKLNKVV